jgi:CRP-like cAMP-binding protein
LIHLVREAITECSKYIYSRYLSGQSQSQESVSVDIALAMTHQILFFHAGENQIEELSRQNNILDELKNTIVRYNIGVSPIPEFNYFPHNIAGSELFIISNIQRKDLMEISSYLLKNSPNIFKKANSSEIAESLKTVIKEHFKYSDFDCIVIKVEDPHSIPIQSRDDEQLDVLRNLPIFKNIKFDDEAIKQINSIVSRKIFKKCFEITAEFSDPNEFYILMKGRVEGRKKGKSVAVVREKDSFAEMSFFCEQKRTLQSVVTSEFADILIISRSNLDHLYNVIPRLKLLIIFSAFASVAEKHSDAMKNINKMRIIIDNQQVRIAELEMRLNSYEFGAVSKKAA